MRRFIVTALLTLATTSSGLLLAEAAQAHRRHSRHPFFGYGRYCYPISQSYVRKDAAFHPYAYDDGYRQGLEHAREGKPYRRRTAGGEFARGFDDGYYGHPFAGQRYTIPPVVQTYTTLECTPVFRGGFRFFF